MEENTRFAGAEKFPLRGDVKKMSVFAAVICTLISIAAMTFCSIAMSTAKAELLSVEKIGGIVAVIPFLPIGIGLCATAYIMHRRVFALVSLLASLVAAILLGVDLTTALCLFFAFASATMTLVYFTERPQETRFKRVGTVAVMFCVGYVLWLVISIKNGYGNIEEFVDIYMTKATAVVEDSFNVILAQMGAPVLSQSDVTYVAKEMYLTVPTYIGIIVLWTAWFAELIILRAHTVFGGKPILTKPKNTTIPTFFAVIYIASILLQLILPYGSLNAFYAVVTATYAVTMLPCAAAGFTLAVRSFKMAKVWTKIAVVVFVILFGVGFLISLMAAYGSFAIIGNRIREKRQKPDDASPEA